ncbi:bifunctional metallophosphatase/5'-nucleotidase [Tsuneonella sp. YG55]|uniref:Bifunctional metallophosphatase/5'-nucleotidase n=1 Tax=Tsuneonella litorea TaxID=2976475 RepID=A0A9X2W3B1_9SPHN|nr:bifunctional metallophosphatase/5'-nucleotidase [Tsuneonella litorea]MCT2559972.1 bifunctional metallophosphatase/5'-nucleotidase [Tsuneonella litorea]
MSHIPRSPLALRPARAIVAGLFAALAACATVPAAPPPPVEVGILAINDFHGAIEPPRQSVFMPAPDGNTFGVPAGGAAWLASAVDALRAGHRHSVTVSAGDLTSASQFASSLFLDEPAVGAMNLIGLDFNAVGNHEFDRGRAELLRLQTGGCDKHTRREPCAVEPFAGARFRYLAANVTTESGETLFPATGTRTFGTGAGAVTVGFVGLTLKGTPGLVLPEAVAGLTFDDEADAINRAADSLRAGGADAVVVLVHQGGRTSGDPDPQGCDGLAGEILPILDRVSPKVDVVVSGHTHWAYVCERDLPGRSSPLLLTSAGVYGTLVTDITLTIDPVASRVVAKKAANVIVQSVPYTATSGVRGNTDLVPRFEPRPDVAAYVARFVEASKSFSARKVGWLAGPATRAGGDASREGGALGNLIADAQLAATRGAGAQIAFMNPFGIRAPHVLDPDADGALTFAQLYQIQPFNNELVTFSLTGAELKAVLEQGFDDQAPLQALTPSQGFAYRYDLSRPIGQRIVGMTLNGKPVDPAATYRVTVSNFLAQGGDSFTLFANGRDAVRGAVDVEALQGWIASKPARRVPDENRNVDVTPN